MYLYHESYRDFVWKIVIELFVELICFLQFLSRIFRDKRYFSLYLFN